MASNIVNETEILIKYMGSFISPCTANYIDDLLKSYHLRCEGVEDINLEALYFEALAEAIEVAKSQLKEQGIEYDVLIAAHVIEE